MCKVYILSINIFAYGLVWYDKHQVRVGNWRVPERQLWLAGLVGGSLGLYAAMKLHRHKTKHLSFVVGIPVLILCQLLLLWYMRL